MTQKIQKLSLLILPFVLCSCFPEVNAPQISDQPITDRRFDKADQENAKKQSDADLKQLEQQRSDLLK